MSVQIRRVLDAAKAEYVTCGYADLNGDLRGHLVGRKHFEASLKSGLSLVPEIMVSYNPVLSGRNLLIADLNAETWPDVILSNLSGQTYSLEYLGQGNFKTGTALTSGVYFIRINQQTFLRFVYK